MKILDREINPVLLSWILVAFIVLIGLMKLTSIGYWGQADISVLLLIASYFAVVYAVSVVVAYLNSYRNIPRAFLIGLVWPISMIWFPVVGLSQSLMSIAAERWGT